MYKDSPLPPPQINLIRQEIQFIINGFDRLLEQFSIFLLSLFHPWDLVVLNGGIVEEELQEAHVWVRHILFDENQRTSSDAWASVSKDGRIAFQTNIQGGLSTE